MPEYSVRTFPTPLGANIEVVGTTESYWKPGDNWKPGDDIGTRGKITHETFWYAEEESLSENTVVWRTTVLNADTNKEETLYVYDENLHIEEVANSFPLISTNAQENHTITRNFGRLLRVQHQMRELYSLCLPEEQRKDNPARAAQERYVLEGMLELQNMSLNILKKYLRWNELEQMQQGEYWLTFNSAPENPDVPTRILFIDNTKNPETIEDYISCIVVDYK